MKILKKAMIFILPCLLTFFLSCAVDNSFDIHQEMVTIIASGLDFRMGSDSGYPNEKPVHTVSFTKNFMIGKTEVMQIDYQELMGINPSKYVGDSLPVDKVNWFDAALFCNALSKQDGFDTVYEYAEIIGTPGDSCRLKDLKIDLTKKGYRLPAEAEWEYACRGGTATDYYWGNSSDIDTMSMYAWYSKNSNNETHKVGKKLPNDYGLYDISGNLYEWCHDWYGPYTSDTEVNPEGPASGTSRIIRGGNWLTSAKYCRASYRGCIGAPFRCSAIGFRVARSL